MSAPKMEREAEFITPEMIKAMEQMLGDVGRGGDFPMVRVRGGSTSSAGSATKAPAPPIRAPPKPPVPMVHQRPLQNPDTRAGDTLSVPKTRGVDRPAVPKVRAGDIPSVHNAQAGEIPSAHKAQAGDTLPVPKTRAADTLSVPKTRLPPVSPVSPIPATHQRQLRSSETQLSDILPVPKTRSSRTRGASTTVGSRQPSGLATIREGQSEPPQIPLPPVPTLRSALLRPFSPAVTSKPSERKKEVQKNTEQGREERKKEEQKREKQQEKQQQASPPSAQLATERPPVSRAATDPTPRSPPKVKYSLFPLRSMSNMPKRPAGPTPASTVSPEVSRECSGISLPRDLEPNNPYGYPSPPPFRHNWATPNRARARDAVDPSRAHKAGQGSTPTGSRPRPTPIPTSSTWVSAASSAPAAAPAPAPAFGLSLGPAPAPAPALAPSPLAPSPFPPPTAPLPPLPPPTAHLPPLPRPAPPRSASVSATVAVPHRSATAPAPLRSASIRDSAAIPATGQFAYYPVMSPYEAEMAALDGMGYVRCPPEARFTTLGYRYGPEAGAAARSVPAGDGAASGGDGNGGGGPQEQDPARVFPLLDLDFLSAEQAAAAVGAAAGARGTIFIDRGFDLVGEVGAGRRSSSCYGDDDGEGVKTEDQGEK